MTTPDNVLDLLKPEVTEQRFREGISGYEVVVPKGDKRYRHGIPWMFSKDGSNTCDKCGKVIKADDRERYEDCPIPDAYDDSLADLAFELRDKSKGLWNKKAGVPHLLTAMITIYHQLNDMLHPCYDSSWFIFEANPRQWIVTCLYAIERAKEK